MILFLRILPVALAVWQAACFMAALRFTESFWFMVALGTVVPIIGLRLLTKRAALPRRFVAFAFFPAVLSLGSFGALLFSEKEFMQLSLAAGNAGLLWLTYEQAFRFTHQPARYQKNALTNLALLSGIIAYYCIALLLFNLALFADLRLYFQIPIFLVFSSLWFFCVAYLLQVDRATTRVAACILLIVSLELYLLLNRLPPLPAVKAAILTIIVGASLQLLRRIVEPQEKPSWWPFGVLALVLFSLIVSAQWFA